MKKGLLSMALLVQTGIMFGQTDSAKTSGDELSIEDLMNITVVSASKKEESLFEANLSASAVSREEIKRSGATSLMEALRLVPGLIVREITPGNYDVHIRGLDNLPYNTSLNYAPNSITLVMINNRPVYNYYNGGTFWETLPVDLNDVEKIEVVRGPSSPLYGPNAAAGVINIITRKPSKEGVYAVANMQYGTPTALIPNASIGYRKSKWDVILSGNYQQRLRHETDYYSWAKEKKVPVDSLVGVLPIGAPLVDVNGNPNLSERYPQTNLALEKYGYNAFANYSISDKSNLSLSLGGQNSRAQSMYVDNISTILTTRESSTYYADLRAKVQNLNAQVSYLGGNQNASRGDKGYKYDLQNLDAVAEYDIKIKDFSIRPGVNFRNSVYDDSPYWDVASLKGFINGRRTISNVAGSMRAEYTKGAFKVIGAVRSDKYNIKNKWYTSYQLGANYKIKDKHFVRANYAKSYRGPFFYDAYNSNKYPTVLPVSLPTPPFFALLPAFIEINGNKDIDLLSVTQFEIGYRAKITDNLHADLELFNQVSENYTYYLVQPTILPSGSDPNAHLPANIENIALRAIQNGATLSLNYVWNSKLQVKPFVTVQQTQAKNMPRYFNSVAADSVNNVEVVFDTLHHGTPSVFGGAYINYQINKKFNVNLSCYYFGESSYQSIVNSFGNNLNGNVTMNSKFLLNARIGYKPIDRLDIFVAGRNLLNQTSAESIHSDIIKATYLVGANFDF